VKSIVIVAVPQPMIRVTFYWEGKTIHTIVPPTYADYLKTVYNVKKLLLESLQPNLFKFVKVRVPLKSLAVHCGLALYGQR